MLFRLVSMLLVSALLVLTAAFPSVCADAVRSGMILCATRAVPSLFPFFVVSGMCVRCGLSESLARICAPLFCRLGLPSCTGTAFFLGILGGYPTGAQTVNALVESGQCSEDDGNRLLLFCNNTGPAFLIGMCGRGILGSVRAGVILYAVHVFSALAVMLLTRREPCSPRPVPRSEPVPFARCLTQSVTQAGYSCIAVACFVLYFSVLISLVSPLSRRLPATVSAAVTGALELTSGLNAVACGLNNEAIKLVMCSAMCAFGGLSVLFQSIAAAPRCSAKHIIAGKVLHTAVASAMAVGTVLLAGAGLST